jgi:hypothetical protein
MLRTGSIELNGFVRAQAALPWSPIWFNDLDR